MARNEIVLPKTRRHTRETTAAEEPGRADPAGRAQNSRDPKDNFGRSHFLHIGEERMKEDNQQKKRTNEKGTQTAAREEKAKTSLAAGRGARNRIPCAPCRPCTAPAPSDRPSQTPPSPPKRGLPTLLLRSYSKQLLPLRTVSPRITHWRRLSYRERTTLPALPTSLPSPAISLESDNEPRTDSLTALDIFLRPPRKRTQKEKAHGVCCGRGQRLIPRDGPLRHQGPSSKGSLFRRIGETNSGCSV